MTESDLSAQLEQSLKALSSKFEEADYANAIDSAEADTGYVCEGNTDSYQIKWLKNRALRHLFSYLRNEAASKFKVDGINLQQKFEHYDKMIELWDKEWDKEQESSQPGDATYIGGLVLGTGITYDRLTGRDITDLVE